MAMPKSKYWKLGFRIGECSGHDRTRVVGGVNGNHEAHDVVSGDAPSRWLLVTLG